jgi:hypothetical protein
MKATIGGKWKHLYRTLVHLYFGTRKIPMDIDTESVAYLLPHAASMSMSVLKKQGEA